MRSALDRAVAALDAAGYDIARLGRRTADWPTASTSANTEIGEDAPVARDRAHDLVRNNPIARRAKQVLVSRLVGGGLTPIPRAQAWLDLWNAWSPNCYANSRGNIDLVQTIAVGSVAESGAAFGRRRWRRIGDLGHDGLPLAVPLQIELIEADQVDTTHDGPLPNGGRILNGIEFDSIGRFAAVWFYKTHPGDPWGSMAESTRVPATDVFHLFDEDRPGQVTGMTWFAAAGSQMRRVAKYEEYELERKEAEACVVGVVEAGEAIDPPNVNLADEKSRLDAQAVRDSKGKVIERWRPRSLIYPNAGWKVHFNNPSAVAGYSEYLGEHDHRIAMGIGVPRYSLSGKLSDVNFSSARIGDVDTRAWTIPWSEQRLAPQMMDPIALWFTQAALACGALQGKLSDYYPLFGWQPSSVEEHDRLAAARADLVETRGCLTSLTERLRARHNREPNTVLTEISKERELLRNLKITSDSNPDDTTQGGQRQSQRGSAPSK